MFKLALICLALCNAGQRTASWHLTSAPADPVKCERVVTGARKAFSLFVARGGEHTRGVQVGAFAAG